MIHRRGARSRLVSFARVVGVGAVSIVSSCGGGTNSSETSITMPAGPWLDVADPGMPDPSLAPGVGGPSPVRSVCLEVDLVGFASFRSVEDDLRRALGWMGIEVVTVGCDLTLTVEATGESVGAMYDQGQFCYTGEHAEGSFVLEPATGGEYTWPIDVDRAPPNVTSSCPGDGPVHERLVTPTVAAAVNESFDVSLGALAYLALGVDAGEFLEDAAQEGYGRVLAAALHDADPDLRKEAARFIVDLGRESSRADGQAPPDELWQVVPHLIWLGSTGSGGPFGDVNDSDDPAREARRALEAIFFGRAEMPDGFRNTELEAWWAQWEQHRTPDTVTD